MSVSICSLLEFVFLSCDGFCVCVCWHIHIHFVGFCFLFLFLSLYLYVFYLSICLSLLSVSLLSLFYLSVSLSVYLSVYLLSSCLCNLHQWISCREVHELPSASTISYSSPGTQVQNQRFYRRGQFYWNILLEYSVGCRFTCTVIALVLVVTEQLTCVDLGVSTCNHRQVILINNRLILQSPTSYRD